MLGTHVEPRRPRIVILILALTAAWACGKGGSASTAGDPAQESHDNVIFAGGIAPRAVTIAPVNPYAGDAKSAHAGGQLFTSMNCDGCHSNGGEGSWAPSIITGRWRFGGTDPAIFRTIYFGRSHGMPAFGGILAPDLVWKLVTYIKTLPVPKAVPTQSW